MRTIKSVLRSVVQKGLATAGFELHRTRIANLPCVKKVELPGGTFELWVADETAQSWYAPSAYAGSAVIEETRRLVKPGDRVLEIGSHHGFYMLYLSKLVATDGLVISVDAHPFNAMVANAQVALNRAHNCQVIHAAGSDRPGTLQISNNSNSSIVQSQGIPVPAITGDELDVQFGPFSVLKIDVEGYEGAVLDGCTKILNRSPRLLLEVHSSQLPSFGMTVNGLVRKIPRQYDGTMIFRSDRYGPKAIHPFSRECLPTDDIINLFLCPS